MRKFVFLTFVILFLAGCAAPATPEPNVSEPGGQGNELAGSTIHVFNWGYFINPVVLEMFEEEFGINVIYSEYESNEQMYTMVAIGGNVYDVLFPSDYMIYRMIAEGLLRPINFDNVPNMVHVNPQILGMAFDPENIYSAPYKWGSVGILYNTTMVGEPVYSWASMWNENYAGQIFMYNSERDAFVPAFRMLGYSINTTDEGEINRARDLLIEQSPLVLAYVTDQVMDFMIGGEGAKALVYSGDAVFSINYNPDLNYVIPVEGSNMWVDSMVIPHNANNPEAAEIFINFMLRPEIAALNTNFIGYTTANITAIEQGLVDQHLLDTPGFFVTPEEYERLEVFVDLGEYRGLISTAFTTVLASN